MIVKDDAELQHILAHLLNAVRVCSESIIQDDISKAYYSIYEIESIEGLVFFNDERERLQTMAKHSCRDRKKPKMTKPPKGKKKKHKK